MSNTEYLQHFKVYVEVIYAYGGTSGYKTKMAIDTTE